MIEYGFHFLKLKSSLGYLDNLIKQMAGAADNCSGYGYAKSAARVAYAISEIESQNASGQYDLSKEKQQKLQGALYELKKDIFEKYDFTKQCSCSHRVGVDSFDKSWSTGVIRGIEESMEE